MKVRALLFLSLAILAVSGCKDKSPQTQETPQAAKTVKSIPQPKSILAYLPQESLFCVVAHDIEKISTDIDDFAIGISPVPVSAATGLKMLIVKLTDNVDFDGIDLNGDFAIMGIPTGEMITQQDGTQISKPTVVLAIPVKDFSQIEQLPSVSGPDAGGIYTYTVSQQQFVFAKDGNYIFVTSPLMFPQYAKAMDAMLNADGIALKSKPQYIGENAGKKQIWIYGNFAAIEAEYGNIIDRYLNMAIQTIGTQIAQTPQTPQVYSKFLPVMIGVYRDVLRDIDSVAAAIDINKDAIVISNAMAAVKDSELGKVMIPDDSALNIERMAYLDDDNFATLGFKVNADYAKAMSVAFMDIFENLFKTEENAPTMQKIRDLSAQWTASAKDDCVLSYSLSDEEPKFGISYITGINDAKQVNSLISDQLEIANAPEIKSVFEQFELKYELTSASAVDTIDGYPVNKFILKFDLPIQTEEEAKALEQIIGDSFNVYWIVYSDLLMSASDNEDMSRLKSMVDKKKSNAQLSDSLVKSYQMLGDYSKYEFVGTYNYVKVFEQTFSAMASAMPGAPLDKMTFETNSNIIFGGDMKDSGMVCKIIVPKKHIMEIMDVFMAMQSAMAPQQTPPMQQTSPQL